MNEEQRKDLWEELRLVQGRIDKFDDITFKIKSWFITIFVAVTGYAVSQSKPALLILNFLFMVIFYIYEVTYRLPLTAFLRRSREIQAALRGEEVANGSTPGPNGDRYLLDTSALDPNSRLLKFFLSRGVDQKRAERNVLEWRETGKRAYTFLFQLRASLIYLCALAVNVFALVLLTHQ